MAKAIFKAVTKYDFMDDKNQRVYGTNVWLEDLQPQNTDTAVGLVPKKISFNKNLDMFDKVKNIKIGTTVEMVTEEIFGSRGIITKIVDFKPAL